MVYLESTSTDPHFNLAMEQYIFDHMDKAQPYFMLWQNDNAVIVGRHQNTAREVNKAFVEQHGVSVVRRLSGGGAVYHDMGNLNFTFITDAGKQDSTRSGLDMKAFARPVVEALRSLGVPAELSGRNDMTIDGRKFSGNAQYIHKGRVMHHGTLMYDCDLSAVSGALQVSKDKIAGKGVQSVRSRVTNLKDYMGDITLQQFKQRLVSTMFRHSPLQWHEFTEAELERAHEIQRERYDLWEWNWGRSPKYSIEKSRRIPDVGGITLQMEVEKGIISAFHSSGDFFSGGDVADVAERMIGLKAERCALQKALEGFPIDFYYKNLDLNSFIDIVVD